MSGKGKGDGGDGAKGKQKRKRGDSESDADDDKRSERKGGTGVARVPMKEIRPGHLLSKTEYMRVLEVMPAANKMKCEVLRGDKANDVWDITTADDFLACSTEYVQKEEKLTKTELATKLVQCKDNVFKVKFRPIISSENLSMRLKELQSEIIEAKTDAALKKIAKKLLEVPDKTLNARLISNDPILGYSLVDELGQKDPQKVEFRNVSHANILSLTVAGTRYVLK